jgi:hypothetical protein
MTQVTKRPRSLNDPDHKLTQKKLSDRILKLGKKNLQTYVLYCISVEDAEWLLTAQLGINIFINLLHFSVYADLLLHNVYTYSSDDV